MSAPLPFDDEPARSGTITLSEIVKLSQITEAPGFNPRTDYGEHDGTLAALAESIREDGLLTPPIVVQTGTEAYLVVDGHRRIAAARIAGLEEALCQVMTWQWSEDREKALAAYTPEKLLTIALTVNLHRKDMNPLELAEAIVRLEKLGKTQAEIAVKLKRSQGRVSNLARLLMLPDGVRTHLRLGTLKQSQGEELLPLLSEPFTMGEIEKIADMAAENGLSAGSLRNVVRERIERGKPRQVTLEEVAEAGYSTPNTEEFDDARIARTLAATKGLDKDPKPTPKDTNGLTRKESDAQFAAAMAPDPLVPSLSSLPAPTGTPLLPVQAVDAARMLEMEPRHLKMLADISLTSEYLKFRIGEILGDIIERRARELGVLPLEPVAPATAEVFPVFEVPVTEEEPTPTKPVPAPTTERQPYTYSWIYASAAVSGGWTVNDTCDIWPDDPLPVIHNQQEAREWAREKSRKNPALLYQVIVDIYQPAAKTEARTGDFWYFRGEAVPCGTTLAGKLPTESVLRSIGAWDVAQELREAATKEDEESEQAQSEGSALGLFGEAQTTSDLVSDMAGRLV